MPQAKIGVLGQETEESTSHKSGIIETVKIVNSLPDIQ